MATQLSVLRTRLMNQYRVLDHREGPSSDQSADILSKYGAEEISTIITHL
jgi:hypothetical protein